VRRLKISRLADECEDEPELKEHRHDALQSKPTMRKQWHTFSYAPLYRGASIARCTTIVGTIIEIQEPYSARVYKRPLSAAFPAHRAKCAPGSVRFQVKKRRRNDGRAREERLKRFRLSRVRDFASRRSRMDPFLNNSVRKSLSIVIKIVGLKLSLR